MLEWLLGWWGATAGALSAAWSTVIGLGVVGTLVTLFWRTAGDARRRGRERRGLLRLLARDIEMYERQWEVFEEDPMWVVRAPDYLMSIKGWEASRADLSRLLKDREFVDLMRFFQNVNTLNETRQRPDMWSDFVGLNSVSSSQAQVLDAFVSGVVGAENGVQQLRVQSSLVKKHIRRYVRGQVLEGNLPGSIKSARSHS